MKSVLPKIVVLSSIFLFLAACGDESTGSNTEFSEKAFESFEDLPSCNDSLNKMVAVVGKDRYLCFSAEWVKIDGYVKGVCNLELCDTKLAGQYFYSETLKNIYQCNSGNWKTLNGSSVDDAEYVDCALDVLLKDSVSKKDDLKKCDKQHDGNLSKVERDIYACSNKEWVKLNDEVITEADLPSCTKDGLQVFVLSKMSAYLCKSGNWLKDGVAVDAASSAAGPESSSSVPKSSSSKTSSASKNAKSSSSVMPEATSSEAPWTDDSTKVRGMCVPSNPDAAKGEDVRWIFINMGGTPVSFEWKFSSNNPIESSNNMGPTISYSRGGYYKASLIVNKGLPSESDEIVCSNLHVLGDIPISGCECISMATPGGASISKPYSGQWKVVGCEGGEPFSYEWGNDASGDDSVGTSSTAKLGNYAPKVTVYNNDGMSMDPVCPTVFTFEPIQMSCSISDYYAEIRVFNYPSGRYGEPAIDYIPMEYIVDGGEPVSINISNIYYGWSPKYSVVNYNQFHELLVVSAGDTVCSTFTQLSCDADRYSVEKGENITWSLSSLQGFEVKSLEWTFTDGDGVTTSSKETRPVNSFKAYGGVQASVLINKGHL